MTIGASIAPYLPDSAALDSLPVGHLQWTADGTMGLVNRYFAVMLGYAPAELLGRPLSHLLYEDADRVLFEREWRQESGPPGSSFALSLRSRCDEAVLCLFFAAPTVVQSSLGDFGASQIFVGGRAVVIPFTEIERHIGTRETGSVIPPAPASGSEPVLRTLTRREHEVVRLLRSGLRVGGIAECLSLSPYTVRNHLKRIFRKTGVKSQGELLLRLAGKRDELVRVARGQAG